MFCKNNTLPPDWLYLTKWRKIMYSKFNKKILTLPDQLQHKTLSLSLIEILKGLSKCSSEKVMAYSAATWCKIRCLLFQKNFVLVMYCRSSGCTWYQINRLPWCMYCNHMYSVSRVQSVFVFEGFSFAALSY